MSAPLQGPALLECHFIASQVREAEAKKPKKGTDIPIPMVRTLPSYDRDYLPVFREQTTYIRGKGKPKNFSLPRSEQYCIA